MRNFNIDKGRFFAVLMVVLIHLTASLVSTGEANFYNYYWYRGLLNIGVVFFFSVSGYYIAQRDSLEYLKRSIIKISKIYLISSIVYILFYTILIVMDKFLLNSPLKNPFVELLSKLNFTNLVNGSFGSYHLWYLSASIISMIIFTIYKLLEFNPKKTILVGCALFLFLNLHIFDLQNILLYGGFAKAHISMIIGYSVFHMTRPINLKIAKFLLLLIIYSILYALGSGELRDVFLYYSVFYLLSFIVEYPGKKTPFSTLGNHSLGIYIVHIAVFDFIKRMLVLRGTPYDLFFSIMFPISLLLCIIISPVIYNYVSYLIVQSSKLITKLKKSR